MMLKKLCLHAMSVAKLYCVDAKEQGGDGPPLPQWAFVSPVI